MVLRGEGVTPFRRKWHNSTSLPSEGYKSIHFLKCLEIFFRENVSFVSVSSVALDWLYWHSCPTAVMTHWSALKIYLLLQLWDYVSNLVHGVLNGIELELVHNFFISSSNAEILLVKVQYAVVELQPEISQQWSKI